MTHSTMTNALHHSLRLQQPAARGENGRELLGVRLLAPVLLFCVLVVQLGIRLAITDRAYELEQLRRSSLQNDAKLRELRLLYAYQTRPTELTRKATELLGMQATAPQYLRQVITVPPTRVTKSTTGKNDAHYDKTT